MTLVSEHGTFGALVAPNVIEWEYDDHYPDNNAGRIRAAVDFLDLHPGETAVVQVMGDQRASGPCVVQKALHKDRLAGRFTCLDLGGGLVSIQRKDHS